MGGRRPKLTADQAALAQRLYDEREKTVQQIADMFSVPRSTVYGHLDKTRTVPRQPKKTGGTKSESYRRVTCSLVSELGLRG
ncbi:helix-turn-helix domain-containing protein [Streptomyces sp. NPDC017615]|uniref:helix-turn-helix domain-containing protein n=1 Tax=Streptomyces sp. NPDC017615 TaxID=3365003 RepID=UPI00379C3E32